MAITPLPSGLVARLNTAPPAYDTATATADTAPPAYVAPLHRISTFGPESIPLPTSPAPTPTQPASPPEYSPSVYSQQQQQQRLSHHMSSYGSEPADQGLSSPPQRPSVLEVEEPRASHFKESRTDLSMRVDLEGGGGKRGDGDLCLPMERAKLGRRRRWKTGAVASGISLVVVVVVVVAVHVG